MLVTVQHPSGPGLPSGAFSLPSCILRLTNLQGKLYLGSMDKKAKRSPAVDAYIRQVASLGGKARAAKYGKATLSKWAKLGGRPPKKEGKR
jgi:hypothetical protein